MPVNWPLVPRPKIEHPSEVIWVKANASVNHIFIAVCDRCGQERGINWVQGSVIVDVDGFSLIDPITQDSEQIMLATLNLMSARDKYISPNNHLHKDRRPDLYCEKVLLK